MCPPCILLEANISVDYQICESTIKFNSKLTYHSTVPHTQGKIDMGGNISNRSKSRKRAEVPQC